MRLRVEGNLAIARTWLAEPIEAVALECERIASEAMTRNLDHIAAIAFHNLGAALLHAGRYEEAVTSLEREANYWAEPITHPFADSLDLVLALLAMNNPQKARRLAATLSDGLHPGPGRYRMLAMGSLPSWCSMGDFMKPSSSSPTSSQRAKSPASESGRRSACRGDVLARAADGGNRRGCPTNNGSTSRRALQVYSHLVSPSACTFGRSKRDGRFRSMRSMIRSTAGGVCYPSKVKIGALAMDHSNRRGRSMAWTAAGKRLT